MRRFKGETYADGTYRTRFGPCVEHNGQILRNSNHNMRLAMRRLLGVRKGDVKADRDLRKSQILFFAKHQHIIDELCTLYAPHFDDYTTMLEEAENHHDDPHQKKDLRIQAWQDLVQSGNIADDIWMFMGCYVLLKLKKDEYAKFFKIGRVIGDLKVPASLQGFRVTEALKNAQNREPYHYNGGVIYFCKKPAYYELKYVFSELLAPTGRFFIALFSDDSCYSVRLPNGNVFRANLDISKCDASHGPAVFDAYSRLATGNAGDDLDILVSQCKMPSRVYDLADRKNYVEIQPVSPKLLSGSTLTTSLNNLSVLMIGVSIADSFAHDETTIKLAAAKVGYILTVNACECFEDIQFLKHSPVLDIFGEWQPLLNIGVLLRLSGTCKGDLPGRGPISERARAFQHALLRGAYPRAHFPLIDNMKSTCSDVNAKMLQAATTKIDQVLRYKVDHSRDDVVLHFHSADVYRRYRLTHQQTQHLDNVFGLSDYRHFYNSSGATAILQKDYELSCVEL
jgi:hypothetical protein